MRKLREIFLKAALIAAAVITGGILLFLIGIILKRGLPQLSWSFLTTATSYLAGTTGILPNICNTLYLILIAMGAALPLGAGAAVYITEYAENPRVVRLISFAAETLTGIPSILFGLIGMLFFIKLGGLKQGVLAGGLTLALMVLPTVMANTRESLLAVPRAYREGALALGSGKWHMVRTVVLPNAVDGIVTGCILSVGRITGESAALLFTAGFGLRLLGFKAALESSSASLSVALYLYSSEQGKFDIAFGIAAVLLDGIDTDIFPNEITALIGPSGCGKSTYLKTLNRMNDLVPGCKIDGAVLFHGHNVYGDKIDVTELRSRIGMVFQKPNPFPMSIYDNIAYAPRLHGVRGRAELDEIVERSLKSAAIWDETKDKLKKSALGLSGGQQQRLCIARALAAEPEVLLMDEPTSALDPISTGRIEELALELKKTYTIVIVTHNMQQAARISDKTAFFLLGKLVEMGDTAKIFNEAEDSRTRDYVQGKFG